MAENVMNLSRRAQIISDDENPSWAALQLGALQRIAMATELLADEVKRERSNRALYMVECWAASWDRHRNALHYGERRAFRAELARSVRDTKRNIADRSYTFHDPEARVRSRLWIVPLPPRDDDLGPVAGPLYRKAIRRLKRRGFYLKFRE